MALNPGANHNTGPAYSAKVCFIAVGQHNFYCQQRQAGRGIEWSISSDVYERDSKPQLYLQSERIRFLDGWIMYALSVSQLFIYLLCIEQCQK